MKSRECMSCKARPAVVKLTQLAKGKMRNLWLCERCAEELSFLRSKRHASIEKILEALLTPAEEAAASVEGESDVECPACGLPLRSYRRSLILGCSECYQAFESQLIADLRKYHGDTVHRGRKPERLAATPPPEVPLEELQRRLAKAVAEEEFELAAKLRDEIRARRSREQQVS